MSAMKEQYTKIKNLSVSNKLLNFINEELLTDTNISQLVKQLCDKQERCLKLSQLLDSESSRILKDPPVIQNTLNDVFLVQKIKGNFVSLKGRYHEKLLRLRLPPDTIKLIRLDDYVDLIVGDTSEKWVLLEAGQAYPKIKKQWASKEISLN